MHSLRMALLILTCSLAASACKTRNNLSQSSPDSASRRNSSSPVLVTPGAFLEDGQIYTTEKGTEFRVERMLGEGRRGRVYLIATQQSDFSDQIVIKIARYNTTENINAIAADQERYDGLKDFLAKDAGARPSRFFEAGKGYALREYVEGELLESWIQRWRTDGRDLKDPRVLASQRFFREAITKGKYIGDLNRNNLIWSESEGRWIIVDSGSVRSVDPEVAYSSFKDSVCRKWQKSIYAPTILADSENPIITDPDNPDFKEYHENCDAILGKFEWESK